MTKKITAISVYTKDGGWSTPYPIGSTVKEASATIAGILKAYTSTGSSTDGTMTQAAITQAIDNAKRQLTVDTTLSTTSTNPVQNKAVAAAINANTSKIAANTSAIATKSDSTVTDKLAQNTAQIETAGTAINAHSAGEYVMISNALYKVTASVAKGDTWTIGTNVTAANIGSEIGSLKSDLANHSALHVLPLSDIADAQNGFSIADCNVAIQGKIVLCWLSFGMNSISIPQWNDFAFAKLKSGYYPAKTISNNPVGIIQEQTSGLTGALRVIDNAIKINTHGVSFNSGGWCWGFVAYVLA